MTIYGIGIDIIEICRIQLVVNRIGNKFVHRILTDTEFNMYLQNIYPTNFLAKRFAAKEAAVKALGFGLCNGLSYRHFEILNNELGKPQLHVFLNAAVLINKLSIVNMHITLTDDKNYACASVIFEK